MVSAYDRLGRRYDAWCRSVTEDIPFYVDLALHAGGPVLEIGVGSGRIAVPTALAGVPVVGVDSSAVMLDLARQRAAPHGVPLRLVQADMRDLPELGTFPLVTVPFRAFLHLRDDFERLAVLRALHARLQPGGTLAFDVFHPDGADITETHDRWIEREPGIEERAHWDTTARSLTLSVRTGDVEAEMELWWTAPDDWRRLLAEAGFERIESYGWFDKRPLEADSADSAWLAHRPTRG
ncbi:MAG TPA: class I SAM-dependent methyltransferase [Gaiellales bacterium]